MKFQQILRGARATAPVRLPVDGVPEPVAVLVRVLNADERATAVAKGREYAAKKGISEPKEMDEVFGIGVQAFTLAACCMDADAPQSPFFATAEEVLSLDPESIVYLYTHWQVHQDAHAPQRMNLSDEEFFAKVIRIAEAETPDPFVSMRPGLQWIFTRTLARQLASYWNLKSPSTLFSAGSTEPSTSKSPDPVNLDEMAKQAVSDEPAPETPAEPAEDTP